MSTVEPCERRIVLSAAKYRLKESKECDLCSFPLEAGEKHASIGFIDRLHESKHRWYLCPMCGEYFEYSNPEDAPHHVQQWLFENRFSQEIWN